MASAYHAAVLASAGVAAATTRRRGQGPPRPRKSTMGGACKLAPIAGRVRRVTRNTGLGGPCPRRHAVAGAAFRRCENVRAWLTPRDSREPRAKTAARGPRRGVCPSATRGFWVLRRFRLVIVAP